jgi:hypothetical protein
MTNYRFHFKPGSTVDLVLAMKPLAMCRKTEGGYTVYLTRRSKIELGIGRSAEAAWKHTLRNLTLDDHCDD